MDRGKVKTAVIVILLVLDVLLGALLLWQTAVTRKIQNDAFENLKTVLHNNGVELLLEELPSAEGVYSMQSERDRAVEAALAGVLTGSEQGVDQGGNIFCYTGPMGEAQFRGSGEFEVLFTAAASDPEALVAEALEDYGIGLSHGILCQQVEGRSIFNCMLEMNYADAKPVSLTGRLVAGEFLAVMDEPAMDASTALLRFIADLEDYGFICTEITSMELGYTMSAMVTGKFRLTPVWSVITDTGEYYVNAVSGAVERHSA